MRTVAFAADKSVCPLDHMPGRDLQHAVNMPARNVRNKIPEERLHAFLVVRFRVRGQRQPQAAVRRVFYSEVRIRKRQDSVRDR